MKLNFKTCGVLPLVFISLVSCGNDKKEETSAEKTDDKPVIEESGEATGETAETEAPPEPEQPASLSVEDRAEKLGFASYLPANTEMMLSVYNTKQAADDLMSLQLYKLIEKEMGMNRMIEPDFEEQMLEEDEIEIQFQPEGELQEGEFDEGEMQMRQGPDAWTLLGQEVTVALGATSGEQLGNFLTLNRRMTHYQMEAVGQALHAFAKEGDSYAFTEALGNSLSGMGAMAGPGAEGLITKFLNDEEAGIPLLENMAMPPIYIAFRAKEGELEQAAQLVNSSMEFFGMMDEVVVPVDIETAGSNFLGYKIVGAKIAESMEEEREEMDEAIGTDMADSLIETMSKKDLIVATGTIGDYVVMMIGGDEESMKLMENPSESLIGTEKLNFTDSYAEKDFLAVSFGDQKSLGQVMESASDIGTYALGLRNGISGGTELGDTRDIEQLLQIVADRGEALESLASISDSGMVAFMDEGFRIESFGGQDGGAFDWNTPTTLAHLGENPENLMFLNTVGNAEYSDAFNSYAEVIIETVYAIGLKFTELEFESTDMEEMKGYAKLFDSEFRKDMLQVYEAIGKDFSEGIGRETAILVDLQGSLPALPDVPQPVIDNAKAPRLTVIAPVTDRSKLASSWEKINSSSESILATISEMTEEKILMQKTHQLRKRRHDDLLHVFPLLPGRLPALRHRQRRLVRRFHLQAPGNRSHRQSEERRLHRNRTPLPPQLQGPQHIRGRNARHGGGKLRHPLRIRFRPPELSERESGYARYDRGLQAIRLHVLAHPQGRRRRPHKHPFQDELNLPAGAAPPTENRWKSPAQNLLREPPCAPQHGASSNSAGTSARPRPFAQKIFQNFVRK